MSFLSKHSIPSSIDGLKTAHGNILCRAHWSDVSTSSSERDKGEMFQFHFIPCRLGRCDQMSAVSSHHQTTKSWKKPRRLSGTRPFLPVVTVVPRAASIAMHLSKPGPVLNTLQGCSPRSAQLHPAAQRREHASVL